MLKLKSEKDNPFKNLQNLVDWSSNTIDGVKKTLKNPPR